MNAATCAATCAISAIAGVILSGIDYFGSDVDKTWKGTCSVFSASSPLAFCSTTEFSGHDTLIAITPKAFAAGSATCRVDVTFSGLTTSSCESPK